MNPGWVLVFTAAGRKGRSAHAAMPSSVISNLAPIRCSVEIPVTKRSCEQPMMRTRPPVTRPAARYENASMRSPPSR